MRTDVPGAVQGNVAVTPIPRTAKHAVQVAVVVRGSRHVLLLPVPASNVTRFESQNKGADLRNAVAEFCAQHRLNHRDAHALRTYIQELVLGGHAMSPLHLNGSLGSEGEQSTRSPLVGGTSSLVSSPPRPLPAPTAQPHPLPSSTTSPGIYDCGSPLNLHSSEDGQSRNPWLHERQLSSVEHGQTAERKPKQRRSVQPVTYAELFASKQRHGRRPTSLQKKQQAHSGSYRVDSLPAKRSQVGVTPAWDRVSIADEVWAPQTPFSTASPITAWPSFEDAARGQKRERVRKGSQKSKKTPASSIHTSLYERGMRERLEKAERHERLRRQQEEAALAQVTGKPVLNPHSRQLAASAPSLLARLEAKQTSDNGKNADSHQQNASSPLSSAELEKLPHEERELRKHCTFTPMLADGTHRILHGQHVPPERASEEESDDSVDGEDFRSARDRHLRRQRRAAARVHRREQQAQDQQRASKLSSVKAGARLYKEAEARDQRLQQLKQKAKAKAQLQFPFTPDLSDTVRFIHALVQRTVLVQRMLTIFAGSKSRCFAVSCRHTRLRSFRKNGELAQAGRTCLRSIGQVFPSWRILRQFFNLCLILERLK